MSAYPLSGFRFRVRFAGMEEEVDTSFQEVNGLELGVETEELREGGAAGFTYRLPKRLKAGELELKRGLPLHSKLSQWVQDALENFEFKPLLVTVELLGENHKPLMAWEAHQAWPLRWALSSFHAEESKVVIETLKLAYAKLRMTQQKSSAWSWLELVS